MNDLTPEAQAIDEAQAIIAAEVLAQTPDTLPLKRPTPVFVEAVLPVVASVEPSVSAAEPPATAEPLAAAEPPAVEFFPPPGAPVQGSLTLELRSVSPNTEIRYALNADDVAADGLIYQAAEKIFLFQNASIAARTLVDGRLGPLATARFEVVQPAWQKIEPTDQSDPTPHEIGEQMVLEGAWQLAAASTRGKLHAHRGLWREDSLSYALVPTSDGAWTITIVSDGAGSANLSRVGSKLLCGVALEHLQQGLRAMAPLASDDPTLIARDLPLLRTLLVEAAALALQKLREEAARRGRQLGDFSSTLLILVRRERNGAQLCAALQAGDGAIALWDDDNDLTFLGEADHGEHSSQTKFLTTTGMEAELPNRVKFSIRPNLRATLVMSDGIADDFFPEPVRFPELVNQTLPLVEADFPNSGARLLEWMRYEKKGSADDRALVICWRGARQDETKSLAEIESVIEAESPEVPEAKPEQMRQNGEH